MTEAELEGTIGGAKDSKWKPCDNQSSIPVKDKVTASNGLKYRSNAKHTPGQPGNRFDAGIELLNVLELFEKSVPSSKNLKTRFAYDKETKTLHRFFEDEIDTWHWSGATNQGANSLPARDIPIDIIRLFNLPRKGW